MLKLDDWLQAVAEDSGLSSEMLKREKAPAKKRRRQQSTTEEAEHPERDSDGIGSRMR